MSFFNKAIAFPGKLQGLVGGGLASGIYEGAELGFDYDPQVTWDEQAQQAFAASGQGGIADDAIAARLSGEAPSAAEIQMQQGIEQAASQQRSAALSTRGVNPALAAKIAADKGSSMQLQGNRQAAMLRAQEQQQALGMALQRQRQQEMDRMRAEELRQQQLMTQEQARMQIASQNAQTRAQVVGGTFQAAGEATPLLMGRRG